MWAFSPTDDSALKILFLVLDFAAKESKIPLRESMTAKAGFDILPEDRFRLA
jgi:hypothetical protein